MARGSKATTAQPTADRVELIAKKIEQTGIGGGRIGLPIRFMASTGLRPGDEILVGVTRRVLVLAVPGNELDIIRAITAIAKQNEGTPA